MFCRRTNLSMSICALQGYHPAWEFGGFAWSPIGGELYLGELYLGEGGDVAIAPIVERIDAAYFSHMPSNNNSAANISASKASITIAQVWSPNKEKLPASQKKPRPKS